MTEKLLQQIYRDQQAILQQRRRRFPRVLVIVGALISITAASIYVGLNSDHLVHSARSGVLLPAAGPLAGSVEEIATRKDFQSSQRQTADLLQSVAQDIAAQKTDMRSLSDQVAALAAKIDALQVGVAPPVQTAVPAQPAVSAQAAVIAPRKKPAPAKPTGPISVGGAPLPIVPVQDEKH